MATAFNLNGFEFRRSVLSASECAELSSLTRTALADVSSGTRRLLNLEWCQSLAQRLRSSLAPLVSSEHVAVQCTYFEKSAAQNWLVPIHQDLSIPVFEREPSPEFGPWSVKEGQLFVQPPISVLEQLVAVRLHLDACAAQDGPLQVVPGSHTAGIVPPQAVARARDARGLISCVAKPGDALVMRPLLLHSSSKSSGASMRRVLHFLFGPPKLPCGVRWQHAV
jgi:ectoine hydroxylase-related dioxygenase (phytanoyl-CoA dioxygenase family)